MKKKIKFCIWDIGGVIYDFSLQPLHIWCQQQTTDKFLFATRKGKFSFDEYMKGMCSFGWLCTELCAFYAIEFRQEYVEKINQLLHEGIGSWIQETADVRAEFQKQGIINGTLSNALPCLADAFNDPLIDERYIFTSYQLKHLKPEPEIFQALLQELDCKPQEILFIDNKFENVSAARFPHGINALQYVPTRLFKHIGMLLNS